MERYNLMLQDLIVFAVKAKRCVTAALWGEMIFIEVIYYETC
jgi:hypothetical protein